MKKLIWIIILVLILGGVWWILQNQPASVGKITEPIKIGAVLSLTGPAAPFGEFSRDAIILAAEEINSRGGMNGHRIEVIIEDDHTDPKDAVSAFTKLVSIDKVDAIIGGLWDFTAQPLIPLADTNKLVFITPSNFRIAGSFELNNYSFALLTDFGRAIRTLKEFIEASETKKLAVVRFSSAFGQQITDTLGQVMNELGRPGVIDERYVSIGDNDFRTTILKLKQEKIDTVFLDMVDVDINRFLNQARELNFAPVVVSHTLMMDALANPSISKTLLENAVVLNWEISSPEFVQVFKRRYNKEPAKSANKSYDAVYILAEAITGSADQISVAEYVAGHNFQTLNGNISFDRNHTVENTPVKIQVIRGGELVDWEFPKPASGDLRSSWE